MKQMVQIERCPRADNVTPYGEAHLAAKNLWPSECYVAKCGKLHGPTRHSKNRPLNLFQ
jgi:hypothetical protein